MPIRFDFHLLGWLAFQQLCLTIVREILGATVQSFLSGNDGGRDGAFTGPWCDKLGPGGVDGPYVVQCKHTEKADARLQLSDVIDELAKAKKLVSRGLCSNYILMTNAGVSGELDTALSERFKSVGVLHFLCLGASWLADTVRDSPRLRALVPRLYGLGDLSEILDDRATEQGLALLASLQEDLSKVVLTGAYRRAYHALEEHGFVLLIGEPAAGKTTIASTLAMAALDQWSRQIYKADDPSDLRNWNPQRHDQFFWVDDIFGATQYDASLCRSWNLALPRLMAAIHGGARVVLTSRNYIYQAARRDLKVGAFPLLLESQVVIDVKDLTVEEREQILYNHVRLGSQPQAFRRSVKPLLSYVSASPAFMPEIARRLGNPAFTAELELTLPGVRDFVEHPRRFLGEVIQSLDNASRAALGLIYMGRGELASPLTLDPTQLDSIARWGSTPAAVSEALSNCEGSFVRHVVRGGQPMWIFKHPTIADAVATLVSSDPNLLGSYMIGSPLSTIVRETVCGCVDIKNALAVPSTMWSNLIARLINYRAEASGSREEWWKLQAQIESFLAHRCDRNFLTKYISADASLLERVSRPTMFLSATSEVPLVARLLELGLLPEQQRRTFVDTVVDLAREGDPGGLSEPGMAIILKPQERELLIDAIRKDFIPNCENVISSHLDGWDRVCDPQSHASTMLEAIAVYSEHLADDAFALEALAEMEQYIEQWLDYHQEPDYDEDDYRLHADSGLGPVSTTPTTQLRSIFDDIDA